MLDAGESERRDELRRLAYGREAGLTEAQAAELRDLELRERALRGAAPDTGPDAPPQAVEDAAADLTPGTVSHRPQPEGDDMPPGADTADRTDAAPTASSGAATRPPGMRRWLVPAAAAAAILLLGAAIGWFGAARAAEAAPIMSVEQSELALDLEVDGEYDPGSVQLVGSEQNANLWRATRDDAEFDCVILTYRGDDSHQCLDPKVEDYGGTLSAQLQYSEGDTHLLFWAMLTTDVNGRAVGLLRREEILGADGFDWRAMYSGNEVAEAEALERDGHTAEMLTILGYDQDDRPVWLTQDAQQCLAVFVDGELQKECAPDFLAAGDTLEMLVGDDVYVARMSENHGATLTIVRTPEPLVCEETAPGDDTTQTCALTFDKEKWD